MHQANELLRKGLHIAVGFGALTLRFLPWYVVAAAALTAVFGNWLVLHRLIGPSVARHERGYDAGTVLYPLMVCVLVVVFRDRLHIAAIAWAILAFGDGFATIGKVAPIAPLPWNRDKSWGGVIAFLIAGFAGALGIAYWMGPADLVDISVAVIAAAIAETLAIRVDDNITVPVAAATALVVSGLEPLRTWTLPPDALLWLAVNTGLAIAGYFARSVTVSGAVGGWVLGSILILFGGAPLYIALLAFFIIGTLCTKLGYARKASLGLAQERGGRRGFSHAWSNVGVATICAIAAAGPEPRLAILMGIASLATAAADTTASEIGQLYGRHPFLPLSFRRVAVGTEGAISVEGTVAGVVSGFVVAAIGALAAGERNWSTVALLTLAAAVGSYLESIVGAWNRKQERPIVNGALNFFNTAAGALLFYVAWQIAH